MEAFPHASITQDMAMVNVDTLDLICEIVYIFFLLVLGIPNKFRVLLFIFMYGLIAFRSAHWYVGDTFLIEFFLLDFYWIEQNKKE